MLRFMEAGYLTDINIFKTVKHNSNVL